MKVFLGWSGETSHKVALAFHGWLPKVIQSIKPYVSSEDIAKGARWAAEIAKELESSSYGIICVTKENADSPWINFEAGALSREIEKSFVSPFLFQLRPAEIQGPLAQFRHTSYSKDEILKLLSAINSKEGAELQLGKDSLEASFEMWWPRLKDDLDKLEGEASSKRPTPSKPDPSVILEELLERTRSLQRETWAQSNRHEAERGELGAALMNLVREIERLRGDLSTAILSKAFLSHPAGRRLGDLLGRSDAEFLESPPQTGGEYPNEPKPSPRKSGFGGGPVTEET